MVCMFGIGIVIERWCCWWWVSISFGGNHIGIVGAKERMGLGWDRGIKMGLNGRGLRWFCATDIDNRERKYR